MDKKKALSENRNPGTHINLISSILQYYRGTGLYRSSLAFTGRYNSFDRLNRNSASNGFNSSISRELTRKNSAMQFFTLNATKISESVSSFIYFLEKIRRMLPWNCLQSVLSYCIRSEDNFTMYDVIIFQRSAVILSFTKNWNYNQRTFLNGFRVGVSEIQSVHHANVCFTRIIQIHCITFQLKIYILL